MDAFQETAVFLSIATTHQPATDLGFLLMKHPDRVHETELSFGRASVVFPVATSERCEAALILDIDPVELVRGRGQADGLLDQYVNDRPYAASSFLAVALNRVFRTAMTGVSKQRSDLAATRIPLELCIEPLPLRDEDDLVAELFGPLGWTNRFERFAAPTGHSRYGRLTLSGTHRLADALSHLYVLIPVLDTEKHYWVGEEEVEKLLLKGEGWLSSHPVNELIARRYLKSRRDLTRLALARLAPEASGDEDPVTEEATIEAPIKLHDLRLDTVAHRLAESGAKSVADLGCGEGKLLARLLGNRQFEQLVGLDASSVYLRYAAERLKVGRPGGPPEDRLKLLHGALTYRDERWHGVDAAVLVEVIEHLDPERLPAMVDVVFGSAKPKTVIITTPNADYNALFPSLNADSYRHPDHRFEWSRAEFQAWANGVAAEHGYQVSFSGIGDCDQQLGEPSQMAVFSR